MMLPCRGAAWDQAKKMAMADHKLFRLPVGKKKIATTDHNLSCLPVHKKKIATAILLDTGQVIVVAKNAEAMGKWMTPPDLPQ